MLFKRKYDRRQVRKIYNLLQTVGDISLAKDEERDFVIAQAIDILNFDKNVDKKIEKMTDEEKIKLKENVIDEIVECIKLHEKYEKDRSDVDTIAISWKKKTYISNYINIDILYYIYDKIGKIELFELVEKVIYKVFDGICPIDVFDEIKTDDPIYYEIIIEDMSSLISKTMEESNSIKRVKGDNNVSLISYKPDPKTDLYAMFLENFNKTPDEVNKSKAVDILKTVAEVSKKQFIREAEQDIKNMGGDKVAQGAYAEQIRRQLEEGDE